MAADDKFTDSIIDSSLEVLKLKYGWDENLINKIKDLYHSDNLTNIKSLSSVFEEIAAIKEVDNND